MGGQQSHTSVISPLPREKTVVITGGNTGIGYETAKWIAMFGAKVILAVRTEERGISALKKMTEDYAEEKAKGTYGIIDERKLDVEYKVCDLSSLKSAMKFVEWFKSTGRQVNILICNACTYALSEVLTEDKFEATYQVTYLSHFLLVSHLLPIMEKSGDDCRIVFISSQTHQQANFDADYASGSPMKKYDGFKCFAASNLFQIMFMYSLDRVLEKSTLNVDILCVDRGKLDALVFPNDSEAEEGFNCRLSCMKCCGSLKDDFSGADTAVYVALSPKLKGMSRGYFLKPRDKPRWPSKTARDRELQDYLWQCSIDNLKDYLTPEVLSALGIPETAENDAEISQEHQATTLAR